ncbi:MAG: peptidylprolyl isomerase [Candidatus Latescibacteria bacterium]|nr:peptidylprolyl isomerase [Candidatus Latescibacterota bacterium]
MFQLLRSRAKFFYWIIAISFILFTFVVWGAQCNDSNMGGGSAPQVLGKINGEKISVSEWDDAYRGYLAQMRQQYGGAALTANQEAVAAETVWQSLLRFKLANMEIEERGLGLDDKALEDLIWNDPPIELRAQFTDSTGVFDQATYRQALEDPNFNLDGLRNYLRTAIPQQRLMTALAADATVSESELREEFTRQTGRAVAEYVGVVLSDLTLAAPPTDAEISAYYAAHPDEFEETKRVNVQLVQLPIEPSAADDAEVLAMAGEVRQEILSGEIDFARAAALYSEDEGSKANGGDLGSFDRARMVPEFSNAAFSLPVGEISAPIKTQFGYHLIEVLSRDGGATGQVHARHILFKVTPGADTAATLYEKAESFRQNALDQGFAAAAAAAGLSVQTPQACREGRDIPGYQNTVSGTQFAFSSKPGDVSRVLGGEDSYYVVTNVGILPAGPAPLADVQPQIVVKVTREKKLVLADAQLTPAVAALNSGRTFAEVAAQYGLAHAVTDTFTATGNVSGIGYNTDFNKAAFANPIGSLVPRVDTNRGLYALRVLWRTAFEEMGFLAQRPSLEQNVLGRKQQEVIDAWYTERLEKAKIEDNRAALLN